ncbi:cupin domain-containing protein [Neptunomonas antarctica]|uniref:Transcriptional regulator, XRE family with cupin sensor n=1 Tax=Neptunomonas antarctica TaxID=619304 RepID=A0A1N7LLE1_9GAMM|nr:cupin domain-containing protein [Neptunomonas antarctica]SIS74668.1 transcriptional regulator, XRE family with cupin sensor [Neptunomonas antarctica]
MDVGERLKQIRTLKGVSQRELAKRAGVTNSTISMIEKNAVSPSVSSLKKILACVPISIGDFFTDDTQPEKVVFRADEQPNIGTDNVKLLLVGATVKGRSTNILREHYPPGADTGADMLQHEGEEGGLVLQGEIELTVGFDVYHLKAGDGYYFNSSLPHRFRNTSDEECQIFSSNPAG